MIKDFVNDTFSYIPSVFVPALLGLLTIILVAKVFTPSQYGLYVLVLTTVNVMGIVSYYWLNSAVIRFLPHYTSIKKENYFNGSILVLGFISVCITTLFFGGTLFYFHEKMEDSLNSLMFVGMILFSIMLFYDLGLSVLKAKRRIKIYTYFFIWRWMTTLVFGLPLVYFYRWEIASLLWGNSIGLLLATPFLYSNVFGKNISLFNKDSLVIIREITKFGLPFIPTNFFAWVLRFLDRYILGVYQGSHEVGLYSIGYDISEKTVQFITMLFTIASNPILVHAWEKKSKESVEILVYSLVRYYILVCLPFVILVSLLSKIILLLFTQQSYLDAWKIIPFVTVSALLTGLQWFIQRGLILIKRTDLIMYVFLGCSVINIMLNIILIPKFGFVAAGISTLISYVLLLGVLMSVTRGHFKVVLPLRTIKNCLISIAAMSLDVVLIKELLIKDHLLICLCVTTISGIGIYIICLLQLREFSNDEISSIKKFFLTIFV
jgi:O-antigen/teichoic acid export membrane protein